MLRSQTPYDQNSPASRLSAHLHPRLKLASQAKVDDLRHSQKQLLVFGAQGLGFRDWGLGLQVGVDQGQGNTAAEVGRWAGAGAVAAVAFKGVAVR